MTTESEKQERPHPSAERLGFPGRNPGRQVDTTGVILAGGRARRMGGRDKGLLPMAGRAMIEYVIDALTPQVTETLINANRSLDEYARFGHRVVADDLPDFSGPLAGMASAMAAADTTYIAVVPCDSPLLAPDLVARLHRALRQADAELAVAHDGERMQPVFALLPTALLDDLHDFLAGGERKIDQWYTRRRMALADFSDLPDMFINVNTPEQLSRLTARLGSTAPVTGGTQSGGRP